MKDLQGKWRDRCGIKGCPCKEYRVEDEKNIRCDFCNHTPAEHCWRGRCKNPECKEEHEQEGGGCKEYEEDEEEVESCDYCSHKREEHTLTKGPCQPSAPMAGHVGSMPAASGPTCKLPGCTKPCFMEPNGHVHDYCSRRHAQAAASSAWLAGSKAHRQPSISVCRDNFVASNFLSTWTKNPLNKPSRGDIRAVFNINNEDLKTKFDEYCRTLPSPDVKWCYHGTVLRCSIAATHQLCSNSSCSICGICKRGFDPARIHSHVSIQRFGHAFYFGLNSSKCHEYSEGHNGLRALLYCQVATGNKYYPSTDEHSRQQLPSRYHSLYGQKGIHCRGLGSLNYDEIAIYSIPEAILPMHVVIYQKDGEPLLL